MRKYYLIIFSYIYSKCFPFEIVKKKRMCYYMCMDVLKKNDFYTVTIEGYSSEAYGVCRISGRAVFVPRALAGEVWEIRIVKVTASTVYARGEKLITPSPARTSPACPHFGICGGCDTWHMSYEEELAFKLNKVNSALKHIGKQTVCADSILAASENMHYRNKGIFAVADVGGAPCAGFYRERSHELIPVADCLIQNELCTRVNNAVTAFMRAHGINAYDETTGKGAVRHIFCRKAVYTADAVCCVVSARGFGADTSALVDALRQAAPELTGIVLNINKFKGNTVLSGDFYTLWGCGDMRDTLCGNTFSISPQAFFQVNPAQAEKLYEKALEYAAPGESSLVFDLYCGAGTISLCLARKAGRVIGAEIVPEAVENAAQNAKENGIENAEFICADAALAARELAARNLHPEIIVVDPPRKGMSEEAVSAVSSMTPERIVYVSCNPATLARDILRFNTFGYELKKATAVDMFPKTSHVESVVLLAKSKK